MSTHMHRLATELQQRRTQRPRNTACPLGYFNSSPRIIHLIVMIFVRFSSSLRNVEDLLFERGIEICHETVRLWRSGFRPKLVVDFLLPWVQAIRGFDTRIASG